MEQLRIDDRQPPPLSPISSKPHVPSFFPSPPAQPPSHVARPHEAAQQPSNLHFSHPSSNFSSHPLQPAHSPPPPTPLPAPAFYHQVGGVLLPFYPASNSGQNTPQTYFSPASTASSLPPPPPSHPGYQAYGSQAPFPSIRPAAAQPLVRSSIHSSPSPQPFYPFPAPTSPPPNSHHSLSPSLSDQPSTRSGNRRMSTIKNLFGRKSEKGRDSRGQEWSVREEP